MKKRSCSPLLLLFIVLLVAAAIAAIAYVPVLASQTYGPPNSSLGSWQRFNYAVTLLWNAGDLTVPLTPGSPEQVFIIEQGESVVSISQRLQASGLIQSAGTFRKYLVWTGLDTSVQSGTFKLNAGQTGTEIAHALQDPTPTEAALVVLAGWRMEEIAAALPTSGLEITPEAFLAAVAAPTLRPDFLPDGASAEGFLFPDRYTLPRSTLADQLVTVMLANFSMQLTPDLRAGFERQGLDVYKAVTLASIVERESVEDDEMPIIASVFLNRLAAGMKLESDPTVQYALGYNPTQERWWTNPLSLVDLQVDSPFNTYLYPGLPPTPISNPSLTALQAVAYPAQTNYYFFRARCDGSGRHNFSETFAEHQQNACP